MTNKSVIVIGAGISGLSAGIYSQLNGYKSTIFELNKNPGGVAAWWERKGYLIDGGIHFVSIARPDLSVYRLYEEIGVQNVPMKAMETYSRFVDLSSGTTIDVTSDMDALYRDLCSHFPEDEEVIEEVVSHTQDMSKMDTTDFGFEKPVELMGIRDNLSEMWTMRKFMKYMMGKFAKSIKTYSGEVKSPLLKEILQLLFLPQVPVWFIFMILGQVVSGQLAILTAGSKSFINAMETRYQELGGRTNYRSEVSKILVESDRACGILLSDGTEHRADYIVPAIDLYSTLYELLDGKYTSEKIDKRFEDWKLVKPLFMVNYGVDREFPDRPWLELWRLKRPLKIAGEDVSHIMLRYFNYGRVFSPEGKTVVQVELETDWAYWYDLRKSDAESYRKEKKRVADEILEILESMSIGIKDTVEMVDVSTPYTMWRYTRNREGSYMGWSPTKKLMMTRLKKTLPGLSGCYLAGQWSMGVGGVLPSIHSGRHVVQLICHADGVTFRT